MKYHEIKIDGSYENLIISDLKTTEKFNDHGCLFLSGILPKETDHLIELANCDKTIKVIYQPETSSEEPIVLFDGLIQAVEITEKRDVYTLELTGVSHTYLLDLHKHSHSFQNQSMTYTNLVQEVLSKHSFDPMYLHPHESGNQSTGRFITQYEETDWEFIKRVASMNHTFLIPESTYYKTAFWIGLPEGRKMQLVSDVEYQVENNFEQLRYIDENHLIPNVCDDQLITYQIKAPHLHLELGDRVSFQGQSLVVCQKELRLTPELAKMENEYTLCYPQGARFKELIKPRLKGRSLRGTVIDAKKGHTKIHLDIDDARSQPKEIAT